MRGQSGEGGDCKQMYRCFFVEQYISVERDTAMVEY